MDGSRLEPETTLRTRGLAFVRYGEQAAATRQRLLQFRRFFQAEDIDLSVHELFSSTELRRIYATGERSLPGVIRAYAERLRRIRQADGADVLWVLREVFPYLPGWAEQVVLRSGVPMIYDFDDAVFHQYDLHPNPLVRRLLGRKFEPLLRGACLAICGNAYLRGLCCPILFADGDRADGRRYWR